MRSEFTPGPWYGLDGDWKSIVADAPHGDGAALICRVAPLTYKGQDRHNKALILASPDLLEVAVGVSVVATEIARKVKASNGIAEIPMALFDDLMHVAHSSDAAIAKAKGEA